jgi:putative redox protein
MTHTTPTPTVVTFSGGSQFSIQIRSHKLIVDQTVAGGGFDAGPTPLELLGASLGSCIAYYVHHFFRSRGLPSDSISVEVTSNQTSQPNRIESFDVTLNLPSTIPQKYMPLLERVIHSCPAHNTLNLGAEVRVKYENPVLAAVVA